MQNYLTYCVWDLSCCGSERKGLVLSYPGIVSGSKNTQAGHGILKRSRRAEDKRAQNYCWWLILDDQSSSTHILALHISS